MWTHICLIVPVYGGIEGIPGNTSGLTKIYRFLPSDKEYPPSDKRWMCWFLYFYEFQNISIIGYILLNIWLMMFCDCCELPCIDGSLMIECLQGHVG